MPQWDLTQEARVVVRRIWATYSATAGKSGATLTRVDGPISRFAGFGPQALTFWQELSRDNSRAWFEAHRPVYHRDVREPMEALLAEVAGEFGDGRVYRPHRDVRFTQDKSPYKEHCGALIQRAGSPTAHYLQVSGDGLLVASGCHYLSRDQIGRLRGAVDDESSGGELVTVLERARATGLTVEGSTLVTSPREFARDHPRIELLRHTSLTVHRAWPEESWLRSREALHRVTGVWRAAGPLEAWLTRHVGPAQERAGPG